MTPERNFMKTEGQKLTIHSHILSEIPSSSHVLKLPPLAHLNISPCLLLVAEGFFTFL